MMMMMMTERLAIKSGRISIFGMHEQAISLIAYSCALHVLRVSAAYVARSLKASLSQSVLRHGFRNQGESTRHTRLRG